MDLVKQSLLKITAPCSTALLALLLLFNPVLAGADDAISLQLKWKHAFQFAGFYMAVEKGYYRDEGLNVKLIEGGPSKNPIEYILMEEGRYGITDTGVILARADGKPVKTLAAIFQHSPLALAVRADSGIRKFSDLKGRKAMMQSGHMDAVILAAMKKSGLNQGDFIRQNTSFNLDDLINRKTDAFSIYTTDQPHQLEDLGIPYHILHPNDYGIDFYGDLLITSDDEVANHPERANAMIRASMKGWQYALDNLDETVELIQKQYNSQHLSKSQLYFEAVKTGEMILKNVVNPGYMSLARWQKIAQTYQDIDLISADFEVNGLVYEPALELEEILGQYLWQLLVFGLLSLLAIFALQTLLLRRMVKNRTAELETSEARFHKLVDNVPGITYRCAYDENRTMDYISDAVETVSGYPASDFYANQIRSFASIIHPDDTKQIIKDMIKAVKHKEPYTLEYRLICRNGQVRWVHERGQAVFDAAEKVVCLEGNIFDISEQKQTESQVKSTSMILEMIASDRNLPHILEEIVRVHEKRHPEMKASILLLKEGRLYKGAAPNLPDEYNRALEGIEIGPMVGSCGTAAYSRKRVIVEDISTDERWSPYKELALLLGLQACWSEPILDSDGHVLGTFAMYYDHPALPDNEEIAEITNAAKLSAIAIERSLYIEKMQKLSSAVEQASEVVTITNSNGEIEYVNPAFTRITGFSSDEAMGKTPQLFRSDEYQKLAIEMREVIRLGNTWQGKIIEKRKDGSTYPAMLTISPIRSDDGTITHFVGVHEDISKIQKLEEQFYQAQKMESIGTLVGGIAHDFNNMLAGITGNIYLAKRLAEGQPKITTKLENIQGLSNRAADMIKQLLTFAKKDVVEKRTILLTPFIKETFKLHRVSVPEDIDFSLEIEANMKVSADITQLQQVLLNLLNNARDAVEDVKQPVIRIRLEKFQPDPGFLSSHESAKNAPYAHLTIKDNGYGIPEEDLDNIFEPFFTTKSVGKGTGLGLSMVFGAVQSHNGIIDVRSKVGKGTTFHIYLPLITTELENKEETQAASRAANGETILFVDDETGVLAIIAEVLENIGYRVLTAENGEQALELYNSNAIDLILTDVVMPKMGGVELARTVRVLNPGIPIVFATGYDKRQEIERDSGLQGIAVINKPYSVEHLEQTLGDMLEMKT
ncbi:PAS domain S-box-containing protein [Mariprofundus aestuarium]|uniref:histidine kinase n=1 Tax=Mariprofundus aestuarium TaxID=1921086 RepID=A0A2K8KVT3_MARES|nr:ABC transporter substrate-binding protein [Mariprofundus aestuarium]ATX78930.1 PAS domain S-box-containing protein [Mariprofundus aestuarium]